MNQGTSIDKVSRLDYYNGGRLQPGRQLLFPNVYAFPNTDLIGCQRHN